MLGIVNVLAAVAAAELREEKDHLVGSRGEPGKLVDDVAVVPPLGGEDVLLDGVVEDVLVGLDIDAGEAQAEAGGMDIGADQVGARVLDGVLKPDPAEGVLELGATAVNVELSAEVAQRGAFAQNRVTQDRHVVNCAEAEACAGEAIGDLVGDGIAIADLAGEGEG